LEKNIRKKSITRRRGNPSKECMATRSNNRDGVKMYSVKRPKQSSQKRRGRSRCMQNGAPKTGTIGKRRNGSTREFFFQAF